MSLYIQFQRHGKSNHSPIPFLDTYFKAAASAQGSFSDIHDYTGQMETKNDEAEKKADTYRIFISLVNARMKILNSEIVDMLTILS